MGRKVCGVGTLGDGKYVAGNGVGGHTPEYTKWKSMLNRCYGESYLKNKESYRGTEVSPEWLDFQVFSEWITNQVGFEEGWHLDKDLLGQGLSLYSKDTCCLVPVEINSLLSEKVSNTSSSGLYGVTFNKRYGLWVAQVSHLNSKIGLGRYKCKYQARNAYLIKKKEIFDWYVSNYKDVLPERVLDGLRNFKIDLLGVSV